MEQAFPGSYALTPEALSALWPQAIFSFDTNVLLSVYSYSPETRAKLLQAMEQVGSRRKVFLTWQVMTEFHRHRMDKIREPDTTANQLANAFDKLCEDVAAKIKKSDGHHPDVDLKQVQQIAEEMRQRVAPLLSHTERPRVDPLNDEFLRQITAIAGSVIGTPPTLEEAQQQHEEGVKRIEKRVPPGFADSGKNDEGVGDYLIWVELLKLAEREKLPVIFVTNDRKEDWWEHYEVDSQKKEPIAPRTELVNEMHAHANVRYHQLLPLEFVELELRSELSPAVVDELSSGEPEPELDPVRYMPNPPPAWITTESWPALGAASAAMVSIGQVAQHLQEQDAQRRRMLYEALAPTHALAEESRKAIRAAAGLDAHLAASSMAVIANAKRAAEELVRATGYSTRRASEEMARAMGGVLPTTLVQESRVNLAETALGLSGHNLGVESEDDDS